MTIESPRVVIPSLWRQLVNWCSQPTSELFGRLVKYMLFGTFVFMALYGVCLNALWDNDIYFIIATGRDILANGITTIEPLTMHEGLEYIAQQWLVCVIDALLYDTFGKLAVELFHVAVWAVALLLLAKLVHDTDRKRTLLTLSIMAITFFIVVGWIRTNPRGFDLLFLVCSILAARTFMKAPMRPQSAGGYFAAQFAIALALANVHSALWAVMLFAPLSYLVASLGKTNWHRSVWLIAAPIIAVIIAAALFNPYGLMPTLSYVFASLASDSFDYYSIAEMREMTLGAISNSMTMLLPLGYVALLVTNRKNGHPMSLDDKAHMLLYAGTWLMALWAVRNEPLAAFASAVAFAGQLRHVDFSKALRYAKPLTFMTTALCCILIVPMTYAAITLGGQERWPERAEAVDALFEAGAEPGDAILASFNDGGYCEFMGLRPYLDARAEVFVPELNGGHDITQEWNSVFNEESVSLSELASRYDFDAVLINSTRYDAKTQLELAGFAIVYDNAGYLAGIKN